MPARTAPQTVSDPLQRRVSYLLRRVSAAMMAELASALAELGLRPVEASMLVVIAANPGCKQAQIGRLLGIKGANMAPLIGALVSRGMILKSQLDGRSQAVVLTKTGKTAARDAERLMDRLDAQVTEILGELECERLSGSLSKLLEPAVASELVEESVSALSARRRR